MERTPKFSHLALALLLMFSAVLFALAAWILWPRPLQVKVNTAAPQTIIATQTVQDIASTKKARVAAANATTPVYSYDQSISTKQADQLTRFEKALATVETTATSKAQTALKKAQKDNANAVLAVPTPAELTKAFRAQYSKADYPYFYQFSTAFLIQAYGLTQAQRQQAFEAASKAIAGQLSGRVTTDQLTTAKQAARRAVKAANLTAAQSKVATTLVNQSLIANELVDTTKTKAKQAAAAAAVKPVAILQGQVIVQQGQLIDQSVLHQITVLGLTKRKAPWALLGFGVLLLVQALAVLALLMDHPRAEQTKEMLLYSGGMLLVALIMLGLRYLANTSGANLTLLLPAALLPLIFRTFIDRRWGLLAALMQTLLAYFIFYSTTGTIFTAGTAVAYLTTGILAVMIPKRRLNDVLQRVAFWVLGLNLALTVSLMLMQGARFTSSLTWQTLGFTLVGQVLGYILAIGITPYLELIWRDDAIFRLNQLSNPNDPLLRELLTKAPGTYHHSMMVASLAANAVAKIGGRAMLTRVACYYHDVGKLKRPLYFTENMPNGFDSPHHHLSAQASAKIIFAHVDDGVAMLKARHMPQFIIDICQQHHGTTLMKYFYMEALKTDPSTPESQYRYQGPKPQSIEAAVINLADTCEAAIRSMKQPTPEKIHDFVHHITDERLADGQFDEAPITVAQLRQVEVSLEAGLASTFYTRIEYPQTPDDIK